ncbi:MAG: efflux RND transporter periplasmic adaptor subunit [Burkholderiaceae bacterium]|jgi:membrane fusion protein (multidrug efflux system)|nr:efflux RND transporter periplasmic adaptor subunit [Burkholderiaceae bacterium]
MAFKFIPKYAAVACAVVAAFSLAGCNKETAPMARPAPQVKVVDVTLSSPMMTTELSGRTNAFEVAEVRPQVSGIITKRIYKEGQDVKAGEPLYQIDAALYEAALAQAQANYNLAVAEARRAAELVKVKAVSKQVNDQAQAALKTAAAALKTAQTNLAYTQVQSPINGRVGRSEVTPGALVNAYQVQYLTTVQQLDPIYVDVRQTGADMLRFKRDIASGKIKTTEGAMAVTLLMEDGSAYPHKGTLQFTGETVDEGTGMVNLRAVFPNPNKDLLPGMFVRARLEEGQRPDSVLLSQRCVMHDPKGTPYVFVLTADNKVARRDLVANRTIGTNWLVESGLKAGERVVIEGLQSIRDGMTVRVAGGEQKPAAK